MPIDPSTLTGASLWLRAKDLGANNTSATGWVNQITGLAGQVRAPGATQPPLVKTSATPGGGKAVEWPAGYGMANPADTNGTSLDFGPVMFTGTDVAAIYASSNYDEPAYAPSRIIDGSSSTEWLANSASPTVTVRLKSTKTVTAYTLTCTNNSRAPKTWTFQGSADGSSWTTLDTQTAQTFSGSTPRTFTFSNSTAYLYYRLNVSVNNESSNFTTIYEMSFTGATLAGTMATAGEIWVVVKAPSTNAALWQSSPDNAWFTNVGAGTIYESWGLGAGAGYTSQTPVVTVASTWRLYRIFTNGTTWTSTLDGTTQNTKSASAFWRPHMIVGGGHYGNPLFGGGRVAEVFARTGYVSTSGEVADLITYFNTEHGLTVPGGSSSTVTVTAPLITATTDVLNPTLASGVTVTAPLVATATDVLNPTLTSGVTVTAPLVTTTTDVIDPSVTTPAGTTVAAPILTAATDALDPTVTTPPAVTVAAPVLASLSDVLNPTLDTVVTPTALALDFAASLDFGLTLSPATGLALDFGGSVDFDVTLSRTHTIDPASQLPQYRLVAVQADGTVLGEVPDVQLGDIIEELGLDGTRLDFSVPKYDDTNALVLPTRGQPIPEVQVWRGPNLETWQKVDGARPDAANIDYDCSGLAGHLDGRVMGKTPKTDWLINGQFRSAMLGWTFGYDTGSIPPTAPKHSVVDVDFFGVDAKALKLSGSDTITTVTQTLETAAVFVPNEATFLSGGAALITNEANQIPAGTASILIEGHTAFNYLDGDYGDGLALSLARANAAKPYVQAVHPTATITTVGKGRFEPLNDNSTYAEQAVNRRVEFHYTTTVTADADAAQWAKGSLTVGSTITNTTGRPMPVTFKGWALLTNYLSTSKTGYGVYLTLAKASAPTIIIEDAYSTLDDKTPTDDWARHDATVTIPADGIAYILTVKFYAPGGDVLWTYGGLCPEEALFFPKGTDRALVVKGLVEHGQDPAMGKLGDWPILIGTNTPLTGRLTKAEYKYHDRREILDAVNEHAAVAHGVDLRLGHSETERWIETHYPRLGSVTGVTLELGSNVIAYDAPTDLVASATRSIVQALESSGADREEGIFTDLSGLGGTLVERLDYAEPGTPVTELAGAAESSTIRRGGPIVALTVTIGKVGASDPELTSWMLDHVKVGDVVNVDIQDGPSVFVGPFRVVRKVLTPETDTLRYSLSPEV